GQSRRSDRPTERTPHRPDLRRSHGQDRRTSGSRMSPEISEHSFEDAIECGLLRYGPDACPEGADGLQDPPEPWRDMRPGAYGRRTPEGHNGSLTLMACA